MQRWFVLAVVLVACAGGGACGGGGGASPPAAGRERGACLADRGCDDGLECWSDRCVRPPPADCVEVGGRLASEKLGNYASVEERAPVIRDFAAQCRRAGLTAAEGDCIVHAGTLDELDRCPRALLPGVGGDHKRCEQIGAMAADMMATRSDDPWSGTESTDPASGSFAGTIIELCIDDHWPPAVKDCALTAQSFEEGKACADLLPGPARAHVLQKLAAYLGGADAGSGRSRPSDPFGGFGPLILPFAGSL